ncbi:hypothetical protein BGX30_007266, partial [Mortierella sp. GBA39]
MATSEGHVKWVCRHQYRASYEQKYTQKLRDVVKLAKGELDEQPRRIEIVLRSRFAAAEFYNTVSKAKGVLEVIMDWDSRSDHEELENALKQSRLAPGLIRGMEFGILAEALKTNSTLTTMDLQYNSIGLDGAKALAEALRTNSTLTTLKLYGNSIGSDGAMALSKVTKAGV